MSLSRHREAVEVFERQVLVHPGSPYGSVSHPTLFSIARAYAALDMRARLDDDLQEVVREHPDSPLAEDISEFLGADDSP